MNRLFTLAAGVVAAMSLTACWNCCPRPCQPAEAVQDCRAFPRCPAPPCCRTDVWPNCPCPPDGRSASAILNDIIGIATANMPHVPPAVQATLTQIVKQATDCLNSQGTHAPTASGMHHYDFGPDHICCHVQNALDYLNGSSNCTDPNMLAACLRELNHIDPPDVLHDQRQR